MKRLTYILSLFLTLPWIIGLYSCNDDNASDLNLDGETYINALMLDGFEAEINNIDKTAKIGIPFDYDASEMKLTSIEVSAGAEADLILGEIIDCRVPRNIRITNGDVFTDYLLTVVHDNVIFETFVLDNKYQGTIDNTARTITVFVPIDADVTSMLATFTTNSGTVVVPSSSSMIDFTNPVEFVATYRSATIVYTVTVIKDEMSQEPKAFIGNAATIDALGQEARTAAQWMLSNVPNSIYVGIQSILDGSVKLGDFKMIWCHFDWTDWPSFMWDTRDLFNDYYIKGGNFLASRDGARYINDVWRITLDQQSPNNMYGGESSETLDFDLGFCVSGHADHPIYSEIPVVDNHILMMSAGCTNSNRTLQWCIDWDPYLGIEGWEERTGAKALAYDNDGNTNNVTIAEIAPREVLKGYQSGTVITVGTPAYEWYQVNGTNVYQPVMEKFTKNVINYLCK